MSARRAFVVLTAVVAAVSAAVPAAARSAPAGSAGSAPRLPAPNVLGGSSAVGTSLGMVARVLYSSGSEGFLCSGTVVAANVVLTAGHCAEDLDTGAVYPAAGYQVTTATQSLAGGGQVSAVSAVIPDPAFDPSTLAGDAALLVLATPTTAQPVALGTAPGDAGLYGAGTETAIAGWGVDDSQGDLPSELVYGTTVTQSAGYCAAQAAQLGAAFDAPSQMCAIDAPTDAEGTCHGDSGGPILAVSDDAWVQLGITSFGAADCDTGWPGFFTRVDAIEPWITSVIAQYASAAAAPTSPPATGSASATATTATAPVTSPPAAAPLAGTYRGHTGQGAAIRVRVAAARASVDGIRFGFVVSCTHAASIAFTIAPAARWALGGGDGMGFSTRFADRSGFHYRLAGLFTTAGTVHGTLRVSGADGRDGWCRSGPVAWHASR